MATLIKLLPILMLLAPNMLSGLFGSSSNGTMNPLLMLMLMGGKSSSSLLLPLMLMGGLGSTSTSGTTGISSILPLALATGATGTKTYRRRRRNYGNSIAYLRGAVSMIRRS